MDQSGTETYFPLTWLYFTMKSKDFTVSDLNKEIPKTSTVTLHKSCVWEFQLLHPPSPYILGNHSAKQQGQSHASTEDGLHVTKGIPLFQLMRLNLSHYRRGTESKIWDRLPEYSWQNIPDIREAPSKSWHFNWCKTLGQEDY